MRRHAFGIWAVAIAIGLLIIALSTVRASAPQSTIPMTLDAKSPITFFGYGGDIVEYFDRYRAQPRARNDIAAASGLSDADVSRLRAMYTPE